MSPGHDSAGRANPLVSSFAHPAEAAMPAPTLRPSRSAEGSVPVAKVPMANVRKHEVPKHDAPKHDAPKHEVPKRLPRAPWRRSTLMNRPHTDVSAGLGSHPDLGTPGGEEPPASPPPWTAESYTRCQTDPCRGGASAPLPRRRSAWSRLRGEVGSLRLLPPPGAFGLGKRSASRTHVLPRERCPASLRQPAFRMEAPAEPPRPQRPRKLTSACPATFR